MFSRDALMNASLHAREFILGISMKKNRFLNTNKFLQRRIYIKKPGFYVVVWIVGANIIYVWRNY